MEPKINYQGVTIINYLYKIGEIFHACYEPLNEEQIKSFNAELIWQRKSEKEYDYIGECKGNENGCFQDSPGHDCGCYTRVPKNKTLEEAAEKYSSKMWGVYFDDKHPDVAITNTQGEISMQDFIAGAKWQAERMYSEEDMIDFAHFYFKEEFNSTLQDSKSTEEIWNLWFEQFKKK